MRVGREPDDEVHGALRQVEERYRVLFEKVPVGAFLYDRHLRVTEANPRALQLWRHRPELPFAGLDLTTARDLRWLPALRSVFEGETGRYEGPYRPFEDMPGGELAIALHAWPVRDGDGAIGHGMAFVEDVTEKQQLARKLSERTLIQARLLQSDRMASVGTLAAGVAHEINNPLAYVKANLDVLASRRIPQLAVLVRALEEERIETFDGDQAQNVYELSERIAQIGSMVDLAREGSERVRTIVRDLKTFSRADEESMTPIDVARVLDASVNMAWNEIRHRARLVKDYGDVPPVEANESRLGQVFLNLLVNAAQAIPEGRASEHEIRLRTFLDGSERVVVAVSDTGSGIPRDTLGRIFDPFFTTKPMGVGTGLGLWICQGILTALGGEIAVDSEPGRGTTVTCTLPQRYVMTHQPLEKSDPPPSTRRGRILIVDDEPALGPSLAIALSDEHDVLFTRSGREALELLAKDDGFDVILCDLMMPDLTGMDVYEKLEETRKDLADRMIFVTGGSFTARSADFVASIAPRILEKPFDVQRLREIVRARLGR
ncbi:ATP-binding protein [Pendulispora albinea]|uniref:histidine kinase n=1 Tax=Pendulispora albinea TaxID=2741071 RepID=A0ABZ2LLG4_9BACT